MTRKIDSVTAVSSQCRVTASDCRIRKMLIAVTAWSFHTVCTKSGSGVASNHAFRPALTGTGCAARRSRFSANNN